jgi:hypothetical protein
MAVVELGERVERRVSSKPYRGGRTAGGTPPRKSVPYAGPTCAFGPGTASGITRPFPRNASVDTPLTYELLAVLLVPFPRDTDRVDHDNEYQQGALDYLLDKRRDSHDDHCVVDDSKKKNALKGLENAAFPAVHADSA